MPRRVGVHEAVVGVGLMGESGSAGRQYTRSGGLQVIDEGLEVHLHPHLAIGPRGWPKVVDLLEPDVTVRPSTSAQCSLPFATPPVISA
jgi:hypothetical protein